MRKLTKEYLSEISKAKKVKKLNLDRFWCQECGRIIPLNSYTCCNCGSLDIDCQKPA
jgi:hypothetical protein